MADSDFTEKLIISLVASLKGDLNGKEKFEIKNKINKILGDD
jgi:hypothetical protein